MKSAVIVFPGSNRDQDMIHALRQATGFNPTVLWHQETEIPDVDIVVIPGGFSFGDYLRSGAIAARSPIMLELISKANSGMHVLGICNGFQILTECGLLPGTLLRNANQRYVCREIKLRTENSDTTFSCAFEDSVIWRCPVAHHDGNYFAGPETLRKLEETGRVVFRYAEETNPNGSVNNIAGIVNDNGNVLGMMPHPENLIEPAHGGTDGLTFFESLQRGFGN